MAILVKDFQDVVVDFEGVDHKTEEPLRVLFWMDRRNRVLFAYHTVLEAKGGTQSASHHDYGHSVENTA